MCVFTYLKVSGLVGVPGATVHRHMEVDDNFDPVPVTHKDVPFLVYLQLRVPGNHSRTGAALIGVVQVKKERLRSKLNIYDITTFEQNKRFPVHYFINLAVGFPALNISISCCLNRL